MPFLIILWVLLGALALFFAYILLIIISSLFVDTKKEYTKDSPYFRFLLTSSTAVAAKLIRIHIKVTGEELLPEGRFLLVGNHISKFDPILTWLFFKKYHLAFISKPENFKVPIYGRLIRKCCFMAIDRENPRNAAKTINQAAQLMKSDETSVAVYPEGARDYGKELLPFHNAVFKIAQKANVPIAVMSIQGTGEIQHNYPLKKSVVKADVLRVLTAEEVKSMRTNEIGEIVRGLLENKLKQEAE